MPNEPWVKMRKTLITDPRVTRMSHACHVSRVTICGGLFAFWATADTHMSDQGDLLEGYTLADLDDITGIEGFGKALPPDWVVETKNGLQLPNYQQHNGPTAKRRAVDQIRQQRHRTSRTVRDKRHGPSVTKRPHMSRAPADQDEDEEKDKKRTPLPPLQAEQNSAETWEGNPSAWLHLADSVVAHYPQDRRGGRQAARVETAKALDVISRRSEFGESGLADKVPAWLSDRVQRFAQCVRDADERKFIPLAKSWMIDGCYDQTEAEWRQIGRDGKKRDNPLDVDPVVQEYIARKRQERHDQ